MAKLSLVKGTTSHRSYLFIQDSSVTTGAGKTGLAFNTALLVAYYVQPGGSATAITLATQTVTGAYSSGGFVEVDATNMPGVYRLDIPNAALTGANAVVVMLKGAANMAPVVLEIELTGVDNQNATTFGLANLDAAITSRLAPTFASRTLDVSATGEVGLDFDNIKDATGAHTLTNITVPLVTTATNLTNAPTAGDFTAVMKTSLNSATPAVTVSDKTGFSLSAAGVQAIWDALTSALTTVGSVGKRIADNLDATVSSRSTYAGGDTSGVTTLLGRLTAIRAGLLDNLDAAITSRLATAGYTAPPTAIQNADAYLDRVDAIEVGATPRQSLRLMLSALAGKLSGAATSTVVIRNAVADSKARITATVDSDGNRTAITTDTT